MPSHKILANYIENNFTKEFLKNKTLIEIGSTREIIKEQNSSEYFIKSQYEKGRGSTLSNESEKLRKWRDAKHAKALHEKIYGD